MKKLFVLITASLSAHAEPCAQLFTELPNAIKQQASYFTWIDVNPEPSDTTCGFALRYFPYSTKSHNAIEKMLPDKIHQTNPHCHFVSQGANHRTEGYGTIEQIKVQC